MTTSSSYIGYFDESGKIGDSKVVSIAGYVSTPKKWNRFSKEWMQVLRDYGLSSFHATDCEAGRGDFKNIDKAKRTELVSRLAPIINAHIVFGVGIAYFTEDYKAITIGKTQNCHPMIKDPYFGCFFMCTYSLLIEQMKKRANSYEKVALVFHRNNEMQGRAESYFQEHQEANLDEGRIASLTFVDDKEHLPLQAADLLVFETYKECYNQRYDPKRPQRKCFNVLSSTNKILGGYLERYALEVQVKLMKENSRF